MTVGVQRSGRKRPLVVVLCSVPLLGEAIGSALEFADVRTFAARGGDASGLLEWMRPDAVIVDTDPDAAEIAFAKAQELPVVHISVHDRSLRLFDNGEWTNVGNGEGPTPEAIRNVVAGALFARGGAVS
jgi:hypothetical protein